jgi:hypothetical protein
MTSGIGVLSERHSLCLITKVGGGGDVGTDYAATEAGIDSSRVGDVRFRIGQRCRNRLAIGVYVVVS